ncbi:hypothetical protein [Thiocystis violacea]|uniref:hypothetical protein n=1 Tax=Thiocystis violacea TaxID=13725 RepID=UPI00190430AE|nr:hypothetical protein [Thiocystis violacea]
MTYVYQSFGAMTGWAFIYGCLLGLASPATYRRRAAKVGAESARPAPDRTGEDTADPV